MNGQNVESELKTKENSQTLAAAENFLLTIGPRYELAVRMAYEGWYFGKEDQAQESFAITRLLLDENHDLPVRAISKLSAAKADGIYFVYGQQETEGEWESRGWVEICRDGQTLFVLPNPAASDKPFSFSTHLVGPGELRKVYLKHNLREASFNDHMRTEYWSSYRPQNLENILEFLNKDLVPYLFDGWWERFRNYYGFYRAIPEVEKFIDKLPMADRAQAIEVASRKRIDFLTRIWTEERDKMDPKLLAEHNLTPDWSGWERYLKMTFEREPSEFVKRHGFNDWSVKYVINMLNFLGEAMRTKQNPSFFDLYIGRKIGGDPEIWAGRLEHIDDGSLLVHSIEENPLVYTIKSGFLGRSGRAEVALCQDRIVYGRGWVVIFQAGDLLKAGYPLLRVDEDPRDYKILKEWRSIALDINLARLVAPISVIPDREKASNAQIANSYFGEEYLRQIKRL